MCLAAPAKLLAIIYAFSFSCREVEGYTGAITQIKIYNAVSVRKYESQWVTSDILSMANKTVLSSFVQSNWRFYPFSNINGRSQFDLLSNLNTDTRENKHI